MKKSGMNKLKNMSVKQRLIKSFTFVVVLAGIAGLLGAILLLGLNARYSQVLELNGFIQGDLGEYNTNLSRSAAYVRDIILFDDASDMAEAKAAMAEADQKVEKYLAEFEVKLENDDERALLSEIKAEYPKYIELRDKVVALAEQNDKENATELFEKEALPHLNIIIEDVDALIAMNIAMGDRASSQMDIFSVILIVVVV